MEKIIFVMTQALYAHMNNKIKKGKDILSKDLEEREEFISRKSRELLLQAEEVVNMKALKKVLPTCLTNNKESSTYRQKGK
jgi:flagella basal body P-ring formation protein FlgA